MPATGTVTISEALAGFSVGNVILIAALFVIGEGLVRSGVARHLGDWLSTSAGANQTRLVVLLMLAVLGLNDCGRRYLHPSGLSSLPQNLHST